MTPPGLIIGVSEALKANTNKKKFNLGVETYQTPELQPYVLNIVKKVRFLPFMNQRL
ncbi:hypothetical protein ABKV19_026269, partial [Rosa sericea]